MQFTRRFEKELQKQHHWLAKHGIEVAKAAVAIHAAVIVLSLPGLRAEAKESNLPLEVLEFRGDQRGRQRCRRELRHGPQPGRPKRFPAWSRVTASKCKLRRSKAIFSTVSTTPSHKSLFHFACRPSR